MHTTKINKIKIHYNSDFSGETIIRLPDEYIEKDEYGTFIKLPEEIIDFFKQNNNQNGITNK